jgi:hypothetical protein
MSHVADGRSPAHEEEIGRAGVPGGLLLPPRDLLHAGDDVGNDNGDGWTLLRHATDVEYDSHVQTGLPLHADVTAFLLARGADPRRQCNGISVITQTGNLGHWLAAEIMQAWIGRSTNPAAT